MTCKGREPSPLAIAPTCRICSARGIAHIWHFLRSAFRSINKSKACIDLLQQTLVQNTVDAVYDAKFPAATQQRYLTAARNLRLPYYDWAQNVPSGQSSLPEILTQPQVQVTLANGTKAIDNPLYSYRFRDTGPLYWFPVSKPWGHIVYAARALY